MYGLERSNLWTAVRLQAYQQAGDGAAQDALRGYSRGGANRPAWFDRWVSPSYGVGVGGTPSLADGYDNMVALSDRWEGGVRLVTWTLWVPDCGPNANGRWFRVTDPGYDGR